MAKQVIVECPRCTRKRRVPVTSRAHKSSSREAKRCLTCRMLSSISDHQDRIDALRKKVEERRMRGL